MPSGRARESGRRKLPRRELNTSDRRRAAPGNDRKPPGGWTQAACAPGVFVLQGCEPAIAPLETGGSQRGSGIVQACAARLGQRSVADLNRRRVVGQEGPEPDQGFMGARKLACRGSGINDGEFDPGSGSTLAACLKHASRTALRGSGGRLSSTWVTCPSVGDTRPKGWLRPHPLPASASGGKPQGAEGGARGRLAGWWGNGPPRRRSVADLRG